jgi:UDP-N-acetylglucosamine acyltransferase
LQFKTGARPPASLKGGHAAPLRIGGGNTIREYVTIHRSFVEGGSTIIGDKNYFMGFSHVAHDCKVGNENVFCNAVLLGGHAEVEDRVFIGGGAAAHQFARIGAMAMVGGLTRVVQDVVPYTLVECDAEVCGLNVVGIRRSNLSDQAKKQIKEAYKIIYQSGLNTTNALKQLKSTPNLTREAGHIIEFIERSRRGICKHRAKKTLD